MIESCSTAGDNRLLNNTLACYMHAGGHGTVASDWPLFIAYLKRNL